MIETARLKLIPCGEKHFEAVLQSDEKLSELLATKLADEWTQFPDSMSFGYEMLKSNPKNRNWGMYFFIHKNDNKLVGNGGFKGAASADGTVEIGYVFSPDYWNQGLATEAARGLIDYAFSHDFVTTIDARTLAEENASGRVLQKCGMTKIAEKHNAEDGDIWQWRILREEFQGLTKKFDKNIRAKLMKNKKAGRLI